jgi:hypothetical protein
VLTFVSRRYHALTAVQSLAAQLQQLGQNAGSGGSSSISNAAEAARPLFEVIMNAAPTPPADSFPDGVSSWTGAAEVSGEAAGSWQTAVHAAAGSVNQTMAGFT